MSRDRIKKLLGMTTANGCTEAEAMSAATKAAKLMAEMGLRLGDIEMDQDDIGVASGFGSVRSKLWGVIGTCLNVAPILRYTDGITVMTYVGREPGPEVATYLHHVTDRAIDRELKAFRATTWYKRRRTLKAKRAATASFTDGMVDRLAHRIWELFETSRSDEALLEASAERDSRFPSASDVAVRAAAPSRYWQARQKGFEVGGNINLAHGVNGGGAAPLAIAGGQS
jgi:hypothetical protein